MANEISRSTRITWSKNGAEIIASVSETMDQTGDQAFEAVQIIGSTSEAVDVGELTGACHLLFKNMEDGWSQLSQADKDLQTGATAADRRAFYELKNSVYISSADPAVKTDPGVIQIVPGSGVSMDVTSTPAFFAIRDTNDVHLLVVAIEA